MDPGRKNLSLLPGFVACMLAAWLSAIEVSGAVERSIPIEEWWDTPVYSPDGKHIAIEWAANKTERESWPYRSSEKPVGIHWVPNTSALLLNRWESSPEIIALNLSCLGTEKPLFKGAQIGNPWESLPNPKNLEECFSEFDRRLSSSDRARFQGTKEDKLYEFGGGHMVSDPAVIDGWVRWDTRALDQQFFKQGIAQSDVFGIELCPQDAVQQSDQLI
jgi:hypothetical protein